MISGMISGMINSDCHDHATANLTHFTNALPLQFFFVAGSILFLSLQLFSGNMQYKMSLINGNN